MICIILAAGVGSRLETELEHDESLRGLPRALLPVNGKPILDYWWASLSKTREISSIYVVTSAAKYKHFERWGSARGLPLRNLINTGVTSRETQQGAAKDLELALRRIRASGVSVDSACVFAGDSLFFRDFDLDQVISHHRRQRSGSSTPGSGSTGDSTDSTHPTLLYYKTRAHERGLRRGLVSVDPVSKAVKSFSEGVVGQSSATDETSATTAATELAVPLFYILDEAALNLLTGFIQYVTALSSAAPTPSALLSCGKFIEYAHSRVQFYGLRLPGAFELVGSEAGADDYHALVQRFAAGSNSNKPKNASIDPQNTNSGRSARNGIYGDGFVSQGERTPPSNNGSLVGPNGGDAGLGGVSGLLPDKCHARTYARVGLMGNPSDGYFGSTLAATIRNFHADVWLVKSDTIKMIPHPLFDPHEFGSIGDLFDVCKREGYHGGIRLLLGTCKRFFELCTDLNILLPQRNFSVKYDTNIPRQVGLAGSSAIVTSLFRALMQFYGLTNDDVLLEQQPNFILSVEQDEMKINCGLQDRVVQVYEGLVFMDFAKELLDRRGYGTYERMDAGVLPPNLFFLAFSMEPSDSGAIHSTVKERWVGGDEYVVNAMQSFASFAKDARQCVQERNWDRFRELMNENFALRREVFTDAAIGDKNLRMADIARSHGAGCKFPGSGGAVVGFAPSQKKLVAIKHDMETAGFVFCVLEFFSPVTTPVAPESVTGLECSA